MLDPVPAAGSSYRQSQVLSVRQEGLQPRARQGWTVEAVRQLKLCLLSVQASRGLGFVVWQSRRRLLRHSDLEALLRERGRDLKTGRVRSDSSRSWQSSAL